MPRRIVPFGGLIALALSVAGPAGAQLVPPPPDPLAGMRAAAAASNAQVCSVSETSACAQANPKILASAMGSTVLAENLRALTDLPKDSSWTDRAIAWTQAAFRDAGVDAVTTEAGNTDPALRSWQNVVAEIHGREKSDEFVILGANLGDSCNSALLVEAARDIHLTGLRPRRSIRFVLFGSSNLGPWAYVRKHRGELDGAVAALIFENGCAGITGFNLPGREDLEPGIREALDFALMKPWGIDKYTYSAPMPGGYFDFLLEGVPSLMANRASSAARLDLDTLKKNTTIAGVLAFGLAEHAAPLGPRLSRAAIESLLIRTGLKAQMAMHDELDFFGTPPFLAINLWQLWESGQRGREQ